MSHMFRTDSPIRPARYDEDVPGPSDLAGLLRHLADPMLVREAPPAILRQSDVIAKQIGRPPQGFYVDPRAFLTAPQRRDLTVGTATAGGHTVQTDVLAQAMVMLLRPESVVMSAGARVLSGLHGNVAIPRQTAGATTYWVSESGSPTESQQAFDQVLMQPRTVAAYVDISRKLLLQSALDIQHFVGNDLAASLASEIDRVAINGSGTAPEPRGILNQSGIGDVAGGTNGLAPTWAHIVGLETLVATANAAGPLAYLTNHAVRAKLKTTALGTQGRFICEDHSRLNGNRLLTSGNVPANLTKGSSSGVCSAIICGNFADLLIGTWGGLDLMVDPYTHGTSGTVRIVAMQDVDVAVRHASSFAAMKDALTT